MQPFMPYPIVAGPTAVGKTALAVRLAQALDGEVVSADSMQIYAGISVGTARPTKEETAGVPHHLQGFLPLDEGYSVARYLEDASRVFADIFARGRTPVMCGGTGLYVQSFMENRQLLPQSGDPAVRADLTARAAREGGAALLAELAAVDPETAARLHENDVHRIVRALEVYRTTGKTIAAQARASLAVPSPYSGCLIVLSMRDRARLYERIDRRVGRMLSDGLIDAARRCCRRSVTMNCCRICAANARWTRPSGSSRPGRGIMPSGSCRGSRGCRRRGFCTRTTTRTRMHLPRRHWRCIAIFCVRRAREGRGAR